MMSILQSIVFFLAFSGTVYFMGRLVTWTFFKVNPKKGRLNEGHVKTNVKPPAKTPKPSIKPAPQAPPKKD
jgi:hypothetical protein